MQIGDLVGRYQVAENPLKTERRLELALVALVVLLLLMAIYAVLGTGRNADVEAIAPAADALAPLAAASPAIPSLEQSAEIEGRPLFWAGRRPVATVAAEAGPAKDSEPASATDGADRLKGLQLLAVFAQSEQGMVIFLADGKRHRLAVGEEIDGWTLESVDATGMSLRSGADIHRVELPRRDFTGNVSQAPAPAGSGSGSGADTAAERAKREEADNTLSFGGG